MHGPDSPFSDAGPVQPGRQRAALRGLRATAPTRSIGKQRKGSFGSIHALLNHILLGDRIWMSRFEGGGKTTPPLNTVLYEEFGPLREARVKEDERIEAFFAGAGPEFLTRGLQYVNSQGRRADTTTPRWRWPISSTTRPTIAARFTSCWRRRQCRRRRWTCTGSSRRNGQNDRRNANWKLRGKFC